MDDLAINAKSLNSLENAIAKYIYKKYIEPEPNIESNLEPKDQTEEKYQKYLTTIFGQKRKWIITQEELICADLKNMSIADDDYRENPTEFKPNDYDSLPDVKRCSYIRKFNNKLLRCANGIIHDESDMCYKHEDECNMYLDIYTKLIRKLDNKKQKEQSKEKEKVHKKIKL